MKPLIPLQFKTFNTDFVGEMIMISRVHSSYMNKFFNVSPIGVDLGNVEIKETDRDSFTVDVKDSKSDYFLFYDRINEIFYVTPTDCFLITKKRKIRISQVKRFVSFETQDIVELLYHLVADLGVGQAFIKTPLDEIRAMC